MRNKTKYLSGFIGILIIAFTLFVAVFAYYIAPDSSPFANEMHLELSTLYPGTEVVFIKEKVVERQKQSNGFINRLIYGKNQAYVFLPVHSFKVEDSLIIYNPYGSSYYKELPISSQRNLKIEDFSHTRKYYLGTDKYGRDVLSRLLVAARISLIVGFISVFISLFIGLFLGLIAGYYGSWLDALIMWFINVVWSIPTLLMVIAISLALGKGLWQVFVAVGLTMWVEVARVVRGQVMSLKQKEYIQAAKVLGFSDLRIMFWHLLPNIMSPIIVISAANFASAILIEAGLSFLGIGAQAPVPSWGSMIKDHYAYIILDKAYLAIAPGVAIMLLVFAFMMVGNMLREHFDVRSS